MSIERLRALEKDLREEERQQLAESRRHADEGNDETVQAFCNGKAFGLNSAAQRIATLIAELGQEVGAVEPVGYMDPDADFMLPRKGQCVLSSHVVLVRDPHGKYTRPLYTSPAHTSEARDAVVKGVRELAIKATAHWDAKFDDAALDVARRFTLDTEPQRRASLQVAIVEAMHRASNRSQS